MDKKCGGCQYEEQPTGNVSQSGSILFDYTNLPKLRKVLCTMRNINTDSLLYNSLKKKQESFRQIYMLGRETAPAPQ